MRVTFLALMFAAMAFYDWTESPRWQRRAERTRSVESAPAPSIRGEVSASEDLVPPPPPPPK
jgi:hypothetical protein